MTYSVVHAKTQQQPLVYIIALSDQFAHNKAVPLCVTPARVRSLFWTAIAAGARGIDYATFGGTASSNPDFAVSGAVRAQAARQASRLATLAPAILTGTPIPLASSSAIVRYGAWDFGGAIYLIAVNTASKAAKPTLLLQALAGKTAQVTWENRSRSLRGGALTDNFGPLAVHIYKIV
jgi:hypothetical protein